MVDTNVISTKPPRSDSSEIMKKSSEGNLTMLNNHFIEFKVISNVTNLKGLKKSDTQSNKSSSAKDIPMVQDLPSANNYEDSFGESRAQNLPITDHISNNDKPVIKMRKKSKNRPQIYPV